MEVKRGDKQTAVGAEQDKWRDCDISDLCRLQRGFDITEATRKDGDVPVYSSSGLSYFHSEARLKPPAVITGRKGILGKVFLVGEPCWPHDTTLWVKDFKGNDPRFVYWFLIYFRLERFDAATSVPTLNRNSLVGFPIKVPPPPEQRAIASALSDVDGLVQALEKLIAKKRAIKQAAMQQLLTGQTRLPGFSRKWETLTFEEMFDVLPSASNSRSELADCGEVGYLHYGDIHTHTSVFLDCSSQLRAFLSRGKPVNTPLMADGDLVMVDASEDTEAIGKAVEITGLNGREAIAGLHTFLLRPKPGFLANGFKAYLQFFPQVRSALVRIATGVSVYGISKTNVRAIEVALPRPDEQAAIATVLSDMDAEIAVIECRRDKTKAIKLGMMQELLTGRTRLVKPSPGGSPCGDVKSQERH